MNSRITTSIAPWLNVADGQYAIHFYKTAFGAVETYRMEDPDGGIVVKLSVDGAEFWLSAEAKPVVSSSALGGDSIRMILTVEDPDKVFAQAIKAGAREVFPIGEDFGWRLGRIVDPFGLHWEIGHPIEN